jgi:hypothetical protein
MASWSAFRIGVRRAWAYWQVLLLMFLGALLTALVLALLPSLALFPLTARPVIAEIAAGVDSSHVVDVFSYLLHGDSPRAIQGGVLALILSVVFLPLLGGLISAFLYGGVMRIYSEAPEPFGWGRFFSASWHWFPAFLFLASFQAVLFLLLVLPPSVLLFGLLSRAEIWGVWLAAALVLGLISVWVVIFELARVHLVALNTRNPFRGLARAFSLLFRHPLPILIFYAISLSGLLLIHLLFRFGLLPVVPLALFPAAFIVQQLFIFARLFARAVRIAGLMALVQQ